MNSDCAAFMCKADAATIVCNLTVALECCFDKYPRNALKLQFINLSVRWRLDVKESTNRSLLIAIFLMFDQPAKIELPMAFLFCVESINL